MNLTDFRIWAYQTQQKNERGVPYWKQNQTKVDVLNGDTSGPLPSHGSRKTSSQHELTREKLVDSFLRKPPHPNEKTALLKSLVFLKLKQMAGSRTGVRQLKSPGYPFSTFCMSPGEFATNILACPWEPTYSRFPTGFEGRFKKIPFECLKKCAEYDRYLDYTYMKKQEKTERGIFFKIKKLQWC